MPLLTIAPEEYFARYFALSGDMFQFALFLFDLWHGVVDPFTVLLTKDEYKKSMGYEEKYDLLMLHLQRMQAGERPEIPPEWPEVIRSTIEECWQHTSIKRPTMAVIADRLEKHLQVVKTDEKILKEVDMMIKGQAWEDAGDLAEHCYYGTTAVAHDRRTQVDVSRAPKDEEKE